MVTAEMISGTRPGFYEQAVAVLGTDVAITGSVVPVAVVGCAVGTVAAASTLMYSPTQSTAVNGIVTIRLYASVAATFRFIPIFGVTDEVP